MDPSASCKVEEESLIISHQVVGRYYARKMGRID